MQTGKDISGKAIELDENVAKYTESATKFWDTRIDLEGQRVEIANRTRDLDRPDFLSGYFPDYIASAMQYVNDANSAHTRADDWRNTFLAQYAPEEITDELRAEAENQPEVIAQKQKWLEAREKLNGVVKNLVSELQSGIDKVIEDYSLNLEDEKKLIDNTVSRYGALGKLLQKHFDLENSIREERHTINKELKASMTMFQYIDEETRKLLFNEEDYVKLDRELTEVQREASAIRLEYERKIASATAENIDEITNNYERQYELKMKEYEILKASLDVEKKQTQLNNVLAEKNVKMFVGDRFVWVANTQDVISAQNELEDAKYAEESARLGLSQTTELQRYNAKSDELKTRENIMNKEYSDFQKMWKEKKDELFTQTRDFGQILSDLNMVSQYVPTIQSSLSGVSTALKDFYELVTGKELDADMPTPTAVQEQSESSYVSAVKAVRDKVMSNSSIVNAFNKTNSVSASLLDLISKPISYAMPKELGYSAFTTGDGFGSVIDKSVHINTVEVPNVVNADGLLRDLTNQMYVQK